MKQLRLALAFVPLILFSACNSGAPDAAKQQAEATAQTMKAGKPGEIATSPTGNYMTCKVGGSAWAASSRRPDFDAGSSYFLINFSDGDDFLSYSFWKQGLQPGKAETLEEGRVMQLHLDGEFLEAKQGEISITNLDDHWVEGTFHFTATKSSDPAYKLEVTDGKFRASRDAETK